MLRNFNMVCILSDVNKIDLNLTFRSSRTPSVCQYKHQSLVRLIIRNLQVISELINDKSKNETKIHTGN